MENRFSGFWTGHREKSTPTQELIGNIHGGIDRLLPNPNMTGRKIDDEELHWVLDWRKQMPDIYADNPHFQKHDPYSISLNRFSGGEKNERITLRISWSVLGNIYFTLQNMRCEIQTEYRTETGETVELEEKNLKPEWNAVRLSRMREAINFFVAEKEARQVHPDTSSITHD